MIQLSESTLKKIGQLADEIGQSPDELTEDMVRVYLEYQKVSQEKRGGMSEQERWTLPISNYMKASS